MNQILDEADKPLRRPKTFSKLAFGAAIISIIWVVYSTIQTQLDIQASGINKVFLSPISLMIWPLCCLFGVVFTIISFVKKEPSSFIKWAALFINVVPISILILGDIYDLMR